MQQQKMKYLYYYNLMYLTITSASKILYLLCFIINFFYIKILTLNFYGVKYIQIINSLFFSFAYSIIVYLIKKLLYI